VVYHKERTVQFIERLRGAEMPELTFYFDLGSPYAYLGAQRLDDLVGDHGTAVTWQPVLLGGLFKLTGRSSWALGDYERRQRGMAEVERRARRYGLPALRWPDPWPSDYLMAMRVALWAFDQGLGREYVAAAYGAAFQRGVDISIPAHVLGAVRAAGLDADVAAAAAQDPAVKAELRSVTEAAHARGVIGVPTLAVGDELYWGDDRLDAATAAAADKIVG
jgi:2-hydroxychromene-2-carboxylate isomerase